MLFNHSILCDIIYARKIDASKRFHFIDCITRFPFKRLSCDDDNDDGNSMNVLYFLKHTRKKTSEKTRLLKVPTSYFVQFITQTSEICFHLLFVYINLRSLFSFTIITYTHTFVVFNYTLVSIYIYDMMKKHCN